MQTCQACGKPFAPEWEGQTECQPCIEFHDQHTTDDNEEE